MELKFLFYTKLSLLCILIAHIDIASGIAPLLAVAPLVVAGAGLVVSIISMSLTADNVAARRSSAVEDEKNREELMNKLEAIRSLIEKIDANSQAVQGISSAIQSGGQRILEELSLRADMEKVEEFFKVISYVERKFQNEFMKYAANLDKYHNSTIDHYVAEMIDGDKFKDKLDFIVDSTVISEEAKILGVDKIFDVVEAYLKKNSDKYICGTKSLYDQMYGIYNLAVATLIKGYAMIGYAYNIRRARLLDPNAFQQEMLDVVKNFKESAIKITKNARSYIYAMDDIKYRQHKLCAPKEWKEGENYFGLKRFLSAYVWPAYYSEPFSPKARQIITYPQIRCINNFERRCSKHQFSQICLAPPESKRRYWSAIEKISSENDGRQIVEKFANIGIPNKECIKYDTLNDLSNVMFKSCICDESFELSESVRSFSLKQHLTDVNNQRVVTGVRFNVKYGVVSIDIQEGALVNGVVDPSSVKWSDFHDRTPNDGSNTAVLTWNMRSLNLDDIVLPEGEFVTGVKFVVENNSIALRVAGTKMYDDAGFLISNPEIKWRSSSDSDYRTNRLDSSNLIATRNTTEKTVQFDVSNWTEDFSQSVLPYLDSREVITNPPLPLGGIGIYYKSYVRGLKEFVSLKATSSQHNRLFTDEQLNVFRDAEYSSNLITSNH